MLSRRRRRKGSLRSGCKLKFDADKKLAKLIALSPRTLQRRLEKYGLDFKKLVDDTRHQFALEYLSDRENTLTQIAFLLGYSEVSAFNRAFKRWTGFTPSDSRRKQTS